MWVPENFKLHMYLHLWLIFRLDSTGLGKGSGEKRENIPHRGKGIHKGSKKEHRYFKNGKKAKETTRVSGRVVQDEAGEAGE